MRVGHEPRVMIGPNLYASRPQTSQDKMCISIDFARTCVRTAQGGESWAEWAPDCFSLGDHLWFSQCDPQSSSSSSMWELWKYRAQAAPQTNSINWGAAVFSQAFQVIQVHVQVWPPLRFIIVSLAWEFLNFWWNGKVFPAFAHSQIFIRPVYLLCHQHMPSAVMDTTAVTKSRNISIDRRDWGKISAYFASYIVSYVFCFLDSLWCPEMFSQRTFKSKTWKLGKFFLMVLATPALHPAQQKSKSNKQTKKFGWSKLRSVPLQAS